MGRFRISIGRVLGVQISLHVSWFLVLGVFVWAAGAVVYAARFPQFPLAERLFMAAVTGVAFFACLIVHELAHAVVARRLGVPVLGITLFAFGGMAQIGSEVRDPGDEFAVALAGPATSVLVGCGFALASRAAQTAGLQATAGVAFTLAAVNLGVALFNLIPGLPLDGGRLLRAGLWRILHDYGRATRAAAWGGYAVAAVLVGIGASLILAHESPALAGWYAVVGIFLGTMTRASTRHARTGTGPGALALPGDDEALPRR